MSHFLLTCTDQHFINFKFYITKMCRFIKIENEH